MVDYLKNPKNDILRINLDATSMSQEMKSTRTLDIPEFTPDATSPFGKNKV